jgi:nucleoprotein TPR
LHSTKSFDEQQEKELIEQHNSFLNEELTAKVSALLEERHNSAETMADLRSKLAEAERAAKEAEEALHRENEHSSELQAKLNQTREVSGQTLYANGTLLSAG